MKQVNVVISLIIDMSNLQHITSIYGPIDLPTTT